MKIPERLKLPKSCKVSSREHYSINLNRPLYGLKQSGFMRYNRLSKYLLKEGYLCIFIKMFGSEYVIIVVYVDDLNIIGTPDLRKTKICLGLQIEYLKDGILVLKRFYIDKSHPLSTPKVVRSLDVEKDHFQPPTDDEYILGPEVPYLSAIGALIEIQFVSYEETLEWSKKIFRYLQGMKDLGLYFSNPSKGSLYGFADAGYLSNPHTGRSQTGYVFTMGGTSISWRSTKQTMTATSSNHAEILAIHEASRECVWLRNVIQHIRGSCGIITDKEPPTVLYEDNAACIAQLKEGYIKGDITKHILPKFFFTHDLQKSGDIIVQQVRLCENLADLFTKSLPNSTF
ncbi:hypothetical protein OSB04_011547 [Centaurea solstitialis]|uniref:Reverse transcriptase Ty1/copia-type domain-containing protein n=1 Tax=Centaurea solstitialis TaxID=347529 RepID=A0AA38T9L9_9ASTR|nr:hypothetical protein OSB04_011547 [Centaurea solstitialis]